MPVSLPTLLERTFSGTPPSVSFEFFPPKTSEMEQNYSVKKIGTVISPPKSQF